MQIHTRMRTHTYTKIIEQNKILIFSNGEKFMKANEIVIYAVMQLLSFRRLNSHRQNIRHYR